MSRVQTTGGERLCASCDRTIKKWGERPKPQKAYCSWCFKQTDHHVLQTNYTSRDILECSECARQTAKCRMCSSKPDRAMVRGDDMLCFKCMWKIKDWTQTDANAASMTRMGWCSWCVEPVKHVLEDAGNLIGRDIYSCSKCNCPTSACTLCNFAMTRVGDNWNEVSCEVCDAPKLVLDKIADKIKKKEEQEQEKPPEDPNEIKRTKWLQLHAKKTEEMNKGFDIEFAKQQMALSSPEND